MARNTYRRWTPSEETFLQLSTRPYPEIAKMLRRPLASVQKKANRSGVTRTPHLPTYYLRWHKYRQSLYPEIYIGDYSQETMNQILPTIQQYHPRLLITRRGYHRATIEKHRDIYNYIQDHPDEPRPRQREIRHQIIRWLQTRLSDTGIAARLENG